MNKAVIFGGTSEGRALAEALSGWGAPFLYCAATEYGGQVLTALPGMTLHCGRLSQGEIEALLRSAGCPLAVDATHPYAKEASGNIRRAAESCGAEYLRLTRDGGAGGDILVPDAAAAAAYLTATEGNVLLATGAKELPAFAGVPGFGERFFARVLPLEASLAACRQAGLSGRQVIAMQGPFSVQMNLALLREHQIRYLVTKASGRAGGFAEKLEAARQAGAVTVVIGRQEEEGLSLGRALQLLRERFAPEGEKHPAFPVFLRLAGRTVLLVGGGAVAARRYRVLERFDCRVRVIAPQITFGCADWEQRPYRPGDCAGAALVIAATDDRQVNRQIAQECRQAGIPVSVADCGEESSFFFPAVVEQGALVAGISSGGGDYIRTRRAAAWLRRHAAHWAEGSDE